MIGNRKWFIWFVDTNEAISVGDKHLIFTMLAHMEDEEAEKYFNLIGSKFDDEYFEDDEHARQVIMDELMEVKYV